mmetsp:Transcript_35342/g.90842  ORF Transcript_35342/g.90842 Transcript_35342/m.90842 type:complete len:278 (+) Transcript_35342:618-1451(+)
MALFEGRMMTTLSSVLREIQPLSLTASSGWLPTRSTRMRRPFISTTCTSVPRGRMRTWGDCMLASLRMMVSMYTRYQPFGEQSPCTGRAPSATRSSTCWLQSGSSSGSWYLLGWRGCFEMNWFATNFTRSCAAFSASICVCIVSSSVSFFNSGMASEPRSWAGATTAVASPSLITSSGPSKKWAAMAAAPAWSFAWASTLLASIEVRWSCTPLTLASLSCTRRVGGAADAPLAPPRKIRAHATPATATTDTITATVTARFATRTSLTTFSCITGSSC